MNLFNSPRPAVTYRNSYRKFCPHSSCPLPALLAEDATQVFYHWCPDKQQLSIPIVKSKTKISILTQFLLTQFASKWNFLRCTRNRAYTHLETHVQLEFEIATECLIKEIFNNFRVTAISFSIFFASFPVFINLILPLLCESFSLPVWKQRCYDWTIFQITNKAIKQQQWDFIQIHQTNSKS